MLSALNGHFVPFALYHQKLTEKTLGLGLIFFVVGLRQAADWLFLPWIAHLHLVTYVEVPESPEIEPNWHNFSIAFFHFWFELLANGLELEFDMADHVIMRWEPNLIFLMVAPTLLGRPALDKLCHFLKYFLPSPEILILENF